MITPSITIWIHGTKPQHILPTPLSHIHIEKLHRFMHCEPGLHLTQTLDPSFHHHHLATILHQHAPTMFPWETLYLFGWSGMLSEDERIKAAQKLHKALKQLIDQYEGTYQQKPFIRIITHSHGGNVALHLADSDTSSFLSCGIDELVLLACPVQKSTASLIKNQLFKKIYSLHSHWDMVQIADPQGLPGLKKALGGVFSIRSIQQLKNLFHSIEQEPLFSARHFNPSSKLIQALVTMHGRGILHVEFMLETFVAALPSIINNLEQLKPSEKDVTIRIIDHQIDITQQ